MKALAIKPLLPAVAVAVAVASSWQPSAGGDLVKFPGDFRSGVHYATVPESRPLKGDGRPTHLHHRRSR